MKKLLCPIDFSEVSLNALEFAVAIGEKENSEITLLNIFTPADFDRILNTSRVKEEYDNLKEIAESKLKAISEEIMILSNNQLSGCNYLLKSGKVVDVLTDLAEEEKYDMIVTGTTGQSAYEKKYLGGKARKIINEARCTVMCVPENATFRGIKKIVYATDYQEEDKLAIQQIIDLATDLKASITILHVSHHNDTIDKAMYEDFKDELERFLRLQKASFDRVVFHNVAEGLDEYIKKEKADLLVLLNKKLNFFESLFHKSLTEHLDKFTDYPLMIVKL
jgi:nucleotide-binding universal stress UspA family protein